MDCESADSDPQPLAVLTDQRNHDFLRTVHCLQKSRLKYDMRKFCFTNRLVDQWNSLPNWVVTDILKRLDIRILYLTFEHK